MQAGHAFFLFFYKATHCCWIGDEHKTLHVSFITQGGKPTTRKLLYLVSIKDCSLKLPPVGPITTSPAHKSSEGYITSWIYVGLFNSRVKLHV